MWHTPLGRSAFMVRGRGKSRWVEGLGSPEED